MSSADTDAFGISDHYHDIFGERRETAPATRAALRASMGTSLEELEAPPPVRVLREGSGEPLGLRGELRLEGGGSLRLDGGPLPAEVPTGYHWLHAADGPPIRVILAPPRCWLPEGLRNWGWGVQLYALRSAQSWGMGDLADLRTLGGWSRALGAELLLINPLHAVSPVVEQQPSPYYPTSRCFRNPLYLRIEEVPGAELLGPDLEPLGAAGRALNGSERIDREAVFRLKMQALERIWDRFPGDARFERFRAEQGEGLRLFARYCALVERHGPDWRGWPEELRRPGSAAVERAAGELSRRVGFHEWLQWLVDDQLAVASEGILLVQDLPIGVDPGGADAWRWQDVFAQGASVGAPPDRYSIDGQNWGLPAFVPHKLRQAGYEPFLQTVRASLRHAEGLRIDHVMGLFRLFWIPQGRPAGEGAYVYYPADDLLAILALESQRAGAVIVGEDLGTVEPGTREKMAAHSILSYRLVWFEEHAPDSYPELAMAAVTTHDLPTIAGLWTGSDLDEQRALGLKINEEEARNVRARLAAMTSVGERASLAEVIEETHRLLARAPSRLITATLDDLVAAERRPNLPATGNDQRPNWSIALTNTLEELMQSPMAARLADSLSRRPSR